MSDTPCSVPHKSENFRRRRLRKSNVIYGFAIYNTYLYGLGGGLR